MTAKKKTNETPEPNEDGVVVPDEADYPVEKDDAPVVTSVEDDEGAH